MAPVPPARSGRGGRVAQDGRAVAGGRDGPDVGVAVGIDLENDNETSVRGTVAIVAHGGCFLSSLLTRNNGFTCCQHGTTEPTTFLSGKYLITLIK